MERIESQSVLMQKAAERRRENASVIKPITNTKRCPRCAGRKHVYKINNGYSLIDSGGIQVECPCCVGEGTIKSLDTVIKDLQVGGEVNVVKNKPRAKREPSKLIGQE